MTTENSRNEEINKAEQQENVEVNQESGNQNPERVTENLIAHVTEKTEATLEKANARIESAENMRATSEEISEGKAMLSPVQQKMKELEADYVRKLTELSQKYQVTIDSAKDLGVVDRIKTKKQADTEKSEAEQLLHQTKQEEESKLALERQEEEREELEERQAKELEAQKEELVNLYGYKAELAGLQSQKAEIEEYLKTEGDPDVEAVRGELEAELEEFNTQIAGLFEKVTRLEDVGEKVLSKEKELEHSLKEKEQKERELKIMIENIESHFDRDLSNKKTESNFDYLENTRNTLYSLDLKKPENISREEYIVITAEYLFKKAHKAQRFDKVKEYENSKDKILENLKLRVDSQLFTSEHKADLDAVRFFKERDEFKNGSHGKDLDVLSQISNQEVIGGGFKLKEYREYKAIKNEEEIKRNEIDELKKEIKKTEGTFLKMGLKKLETSLTTKQTELESMRDRAHKKYIEMILSNEQSNAIYSILNSYISHKGSKNPINNVSFEQIKEMFKSKSAEEITDESSVTKIKNLLDFFEGDPTEDQLKLEKEKTQKYNESYEMNKKFDKYF